MAGNGSTRGSKAPQVDAEQSTSVKTSTVSFRQRACRGIPGLLDWIEEAEIVNRRFTARLQIAILAVVLVLLLLARFGCAP